MKWGLYQTWSRNPGVVKKLHLVIFVLSISLLCSLVQILHIGQKPVKPDDNKEEQSFYEAVEDESVQSFDLDHFIKTYLERFFGTEDQDLEFVGAHTSSGLFVDKVYVEMKKRQGMGLKTQFILNNVISESIDANKIKAICFGREVFVNKEYQDRNFIIELLVDVNRKKVTAIPVLRVE